MKTKRLLTLILLLSPSFCLAEDPVPAEQKQQARLEVVTAANAGLMPASSNYDLNAYFQSNVATGTAEANIEIMDSITKAPTTEAEEVSARAAVEMIEFLQDERTRKLNDLYFR